MPEPFDTESCERPQQGFKAGYFPDVLVTTHEGRRAIFYSDLLRGKTVLIHFMSTRDPNSLRLTANIAKVQQHLGDRLGRDVFIYSVTVDPAHDTTAVLNTYATQRGARPGWLFLTGQQSAIDSLKDRFFASGPSHDHSSMQDCSMAMVRYGNEATGLWGTVPSTIDPIWIARRLSWVQSRTPAPAGKFVRKGPPLLRAVSTLLILAAVISRAQNPSPVEHRTMMPALPMSTVNTTNPQKTIIVTGTSSFPKSDPWLEPPGSNMLPTIYTEAYGSDGIPIPNTLPSKPSVYYNLHDGDPKISIINPTSPQDDLKSFFTAISAQATALRDRKSTRLNSSHG